MSTDTLKKTIQKIEDGFVVNEHGRWLYMAEQRIYEKRVIEQIVNGNVLVDGKWVAIGEARRLALRNKAAAKKQPAQTPPAPATPLVPPPQHTETVSFEAVGDMLETICMDMSPAIKPQEETAAEADNDDEATPGHVDSVLISGLSNNSAAEHSRYAMTFIDDLSHSHKRGGFFGKLVKILIALAAVAGAAAVSLRYIAAVLIFAVLLVTGAQAGLLDGYYQISSLVLTYNDKDKQGFNNNNLYIMANDKRVRLIGAWRGYPLKQDAIVEKTIGDTLVLRDAENPQIVFKFRIRNNTIAGRHAITEEDGTRQIIDSKAVIRQLSQSEIDRLKIIFSLP